MAAVMRVFFMTLAPFVSAAADAAENGAGGRRNALKCFRAQEGSRLAPWRINQGRPAEVQASPPFGRLSD